MYYTAILFITAGTLTQAIRNFAKSLEGWLTNAVQGYPKAIVGAKVWCRITHPVHPSFDSGVCTVQQCLLSALQIASVVAFSQTLRRYTSLNHLAQAARAVLQNSGQVSQMLSDLNRVDFGNVQVGSSWQAHCHCDLGFTCVGM